MTRPKAPRNPRPPSTKPSKLPPTPPPPYDPRGGATKPARLPPPAPQAPVQIIRPRSRVVNRTQQFPSSISGEILANRAPLPVVYGRTRMTLQPAFWRFYAENNSGQVRGFYYGLWPICYGEIEEIETVFFDGVEFGTVFPNAGEDNRQAYLDTFVGTSGQTAPSWLVGAFALNGSGGASGITYDDDLPNVAYVVLRVPREDIRQFPQIEVIIKGNAEIYDPRDLSTGYSDNPSLCLRDFLTNTTYGLGLTVDDASVEDAADENDDLVSGEKRRVIGLPLNKQAPGVDWAETLQVYAGVFLDWTGGSVRFIPDRPGTSAATYTDDDIIANSADWEKGGIFDRVEGVRVIWFDPDTNEEREILYPTSADPAKVSTLRLPGFTNYQQARREAIERYNHLSLEDFRGSFELKNAALARSVGDLITVTESSAAVSSKVFRIMGMANPSPGRYVPKVVEYQAAAYSDDATSDPGTPDNFLPDPFDVPTVTGLTLTQVEEIDTDGTRKLRIRAAWDAATWPYVKGYELQVRSSTGSAGFTNGDFSSGFTGWTDVSQTGPGTDGTATEDSGELLLTDGVATPPDVGSPTRRYAAAEQTITGLVVGANCKVTAEITAYPSGAAAIAQILDSTDTVLDEVIIPPIASLPYTFELEWKATETSATVYVRNPDTGSTPAVFTSRWDNFVFEQETVDVATTTTDTEVITQPLPDSVTYYARVRIIPQTGGPPGDWTSEVSIALSGALTPTAAKVDSTETIDGSWTFDADVNFDDDVRARFGSGGLLRIYHSGSNGEIRNFSGNWFFRQRAHGASYSFRAEDDAGTDRELMELNGQDGWHLQHPRSHTILLGMDDTGLHIDNLPTSDPGAGYLWNDSGTIKIGT